MSIKDKENINEMQQKDEIHDEDSCSNDIKYNTNHNGVVPDDFHTQFDTGARPKRKLNTVFQVETNEKFELNTEITLSDYFDSKPKKKRRFDTKQQIKTRHEERMKFIKHFVEISTKYSQFLERKIDKKDTGKILKTKQEKTESSIKKDNIDVTKQLKYFEGGDLRPYQIEGVTWLTVLFENSVNGILADEMGLGKTIQVIALICHLYERNIPGPFLIVAPLSTLGNWLEEFKKFAPKLPVMRLQGYEYERKEQIKRIQQKFILEGRVVKPVVICTYQIPLIEEHFLNKFIWQYIIVDEGHRIKNPDSKLSQELRRIQSSNRLLLTGTPLQNDIKELWALFNFLMPELFNNMEGFSSLIELEDMEDKDKILANEAETKIISTIHKVLAPFMLRREKKYVLNDIVPKKEVIIYCPLTELQKYLYKAVLHRDYKKLTMQPDPEQIQVDSPRGKRQCTQKKFVNDSINLDDSSQDILLLPKLMMKKSEPPVYFTNEHVPVKCPDCKYLCRITMENVTMMLRKAVNHPYLIWYPLDPKSEQRQVFINEDLIKHSGKLLVLDAILPKLKAGGHKVLIFTTSVMFMDFIEEFLILRNYNYRRLDGSDDFDVRKDNISQFESDSNVFAFLISTRAGGLGLNLTAADTVIFMDRDWNPMADIQAQDRCHRIGQTKPVMVYSLIVKNTIDEVIVMRGDMKKRLEKIVIKEGKFQTLKKKWNDNELKELEDLLKQEDELMKIKPNGLIYTDQELNKILDRTELYQQMNSVGKENQP